METVVRYNKAMLEQGLVVERLENQQRSKTMREHSQYQSMTGMIKKNELWLE